MRLFQSLLPCCYSRLAVDHSGFQDIKRWCEEPFLRYTLQCLKTLTSKRGKPFQGITGVSDRVSDTFISGQSHQSLAKICVLGNFQRSAPLLVSQRLQSLFGALFGLRLRIFHLHGLLQCLASSVLKQQVEVIPSCTSINTVTVSGNCTLRNISRANPRGFLVICFDQKSHGSPL